MSSNETAMVAIVVMVVIAGVFLAWAVWLFARNHRERLRSELEVRRRMLEKFGTGDELRAFLSSEGGRKFLEDLSTEHASHADKILTSFKRGAILTLLGIGFWILVAWNPHDLEPLGIFGTLALAAGLGYLASAAVAYRFAKRWGLLPAEVD